MRRVAMSFLCVLMILTISQAQYQIGLAPRVSPDTEIYKKIGYTEVRIRYGAPSVKGREIFGDVEPYDHVWRAGANEATTLEISSNIDLEAGVLPAGKYALFIIPRERESWTVIFNHQSKQWGAFDYDESMDALRVDVVPQRLSEKVETLRYDIEAQGITSGAIIMTWSDVKLQIPFTTEFAEELGTILDERLASSDSSTHWVIYLQAAEVLVSQDKDLDTAEKWLDLSDKYAAPSESGWDKRYYPIAYIRSHALWTRAKLLALKGDYSTAAALGEALSTDKEHEMFYKRKGESQNINTLVSEWSKQ